jgi:hypothetical protein
MPAPIGARVLMIVIAITALAPLVPSAQVAADEAGAPSATVVAQVSDPPVDAERWWGAAGAILCGAEVRLIRAVPAIGMNPYVLAAGVGGCLLAVMDIVTTD